MTHTPSTTGLRSPNLPATVWILVIARAVNHLAAFTLTFLSVTLVKDLGATVNQAGYLLAAFGLATIPSRLIGGRLADKIGGKATILIGLTGTALAQLALAGSHTLTQASYAVVALGLMFEIYEPSSQSIIADVTPAAQRPTAYGLLAASLAAAGMGAGLLAALLARADLRWLFVADAATCLLCAGTIAVLLPSKTRTLAADREPQRSRPWRDRRLLAMLALGTVFAAIYLQIYVALPLTLTCRGLDASAMGILLTVSATTMVAGQAILARSRFRTIDDLTAMTWGYLVLAVGLLGNGYATSITEFLITTFLWSIGDLILVGRAYTIVAAIAPANARGRFLAVYGTSWGIASIAAPVTSTQLLTHGGPTLLWGSAAASCLALAAAAPLLRAHLPDHPVSTTDPAQPSSSPANAEQPRMRK